MRLPALLPLVLAGALTLAPAAAATPGGAQWPDPKPRPGGAGTRTALPKPKRKPAAGKPAPAKPVRAAPLPAGRGDVFPVAGAHGFGGAGARFGAGRAGHIHQGQDITAALGTPVVSPHAGVVVYRGYQPAGAGRYLVVRSSAERRDYVFMHLATGTIRVAPGDRVSRGEVLAEVGLTGDSTGPHLHFEIWLGPWQTGGRPVDPLPYLRAWGG